MVIVLCNAPPDHATGLARAVIGEGLAACANLLPARSVYRWEGQICDEPEVTMVIKVDAAKVDALRERLVALHPYDLPEVLVLPIDVSASHAPYVAWVLGA